MLQVAGVGLQTVVKQNLHGDWKSASARERLLNRISISSEQCNGGPHESGHEARLAETKGH